MDRDYGLPLDRAWAISRIAVAISITVTIGGGSFLFFSMVIVYLALKSWVLLHADSLEAHIASGAVGSVFWLIIAATQAWSASWGIAVLSASLAFDSYAYHRSSLRRIAFFNARRK